MKATQKMIIAARRAEHDHHQRGQSDPGRFIPTPDGIIRVMLAAALNPVDAADAPFTDGRPAA